MKNLHKERKFRLRELLSSQKLAWCLAWVLGIATVLSVLGLVMLSGWFITMAGVAGVIALGAHAFNYLMPAAIIRTFAFIRTFARYGDLMVSHHAVFGLLKELRVRFFAHWARLPILLRMHKQDADSSAETMQRLVRDIDTLDEFPLRVVSPIIVATVAVFVLVLITLYHLPDAFMSAIFMILALVLAVMTLRMGVDLAKRESELITLRKSELLHALPALTALLTWGRWNDTVNTVTRLDDAHRAHTLTIMRKKRNTQALIQGIIAVAVIVLLFLAGRYFERGITPFMLDNLNSHDVLNPAVILALTLGVFGLMEIVSMLVSEPLAWGRSMHAKARVNALIDADMDGVATPKQPCIDNAVITLKDVSVKMPNAMLGVHGIHAILGHDKPTLIIGASGAGKSTLLATLAGEIPRMDGTILVGDVDMNEVDFGKSLGYLGQNVDIFDQTLADNLRLGKPSASDDELWAVLDKVCLTTWAKSQPKGLDTPLGEYGMAISGGQGRRVALARLLLAPKQVLLLDEPFAGLDAATRQTVWQSLVDMQRQGDIGVLVIATHQRWQEMGEVNVLTVAGA